MLRAESGENGRGKDQYGKGGEDLIVRVPVGTQVYDDETGELVADLRRPGSAVVMAKGGRGGRGNIHFANSVNQSPNYAEKGESGRAGELRLELKLLADVGPARLPERRQEHVHRGGVARAPQDRGLPVHHVGAEPRRRLAG